MTQARMTPIVNINGDSREELVRQRRDVADACFALIKALSDMAPNGRNYIGNTELLETDRGIHRDRVALIDHLRNAVIDEAVAIQNGGL